MKSHKEFTEEIIELTREPTLPEKTKDVLNVPHACPSCNLESNNKEDFSYVEGDTLHYCDKCIKKNNLIKRDVINVKEVTE